MDPFITATDSTGECIAQTCDGVPYRIGPEGAQLLDYNPGLSDLLPDEGFGELE